MTLDELLNIGNEAADDVASKAERMGLCPSGAGMGRARTKAIVEALRDDVVKVVMNANVDLPRHEAEGMVDRQFINEILASDGAQGTHGSPELDEDARKLEAMGQDAGPTVQDLFPEVFAPAAAPTVGQRLIKAAHEAAAIARGEVSDPSYTGGMNDLCVTDAAPAVCEWKQLGDRHGHFTRECSKYPTTSAAGDYCSNCGKPIKFTEAAR